MVRLTELNSPLLVPPDGGYLVNLMVPAHDPDTLKAYPGRPLSIQISERSVCDLQLIASKFDPQQILDAMRPGSSPLHLEPFRTNEAFGRV